MVDERFGPSLPVRWALVEALEATPQCSSQWLELLLEMTPVTDAARVERLAYLLGACRAHRAGRLVELETRGIEFQAAMLEQTADIGLRTAHQLLVLEVQHP